MSQSEIPTSPVTRSAPSACAGAKAPWPKRFVEDVLFDLQLGIRQVRSQVGVAVTVVAVLALAIGTNVAIFNLLHALLYAPPGYKDPEAVMRVVPVDRKNPRQPLDFSYRSFRQIHESNRVFASTAAYSNTIIGLGQVGDERRAIAAFVSQDYFNVLGVPPAAGRAFLADESAFGASRPVVIVGDQFWKKYGYPREIIGRTVDIGDRKFTVVGVMPQGFKGTLNLFSTEVWLPVGMYDAMQNGSVAGDAVQDAEKFIVIGRLKPGATPVAAEAELAGLAQELGGSFTTARESRTIRVERPTRFASAENDRAVSWIGMILLGLAGVVLLIACLNLANMFLARGSVRGQEIAIRFSMGATRFRIIRQLVTEGMVLACIGGVAGLVLALWSSNLLVTSLSERVPIELSWAPRLQPVLLLAAAGFSFFSTLIFAFAPAIRLTRNSVMEELKEKGGAGKGKRRFAYIPRNWLVVVQIALSLALLTTAALFVRAAGKAASIETGLKTERNFLVEADTALSALPAARAQDLYLRIRQRLASLPQVQQVGISIDVPFGGMDLQKRVRRADGGATAATPIDAKWNSVDADYFATVGLPILRGRAFTATEADQGGKGVVIINEVLEERLWGRGQGVGQLVEFVTDAAAGAAGVGGAAPSSQVMTVVGVVPPMRHVVFESKPDPDVYLPLAAGFQSHAFFHIRVASLTPGAESVMTDLFRKTIQEVDVATPVLSIKSFAQHIDTNMQIWIVRTGATIFSIFGAIALVLATAGAYGVIAYSVARRTREIGIRMALGAQPGNILRMVLHEAAVMMVAGIVIGLLLSLGLGQVVSRMLYGVGARDPIAFGGALTFLAAATFFACWVPASRSTRVDPSTSLRAT